MSNLIDNDESPGLTVMPQAFWHQAVNLFATRAGAQTLIEVLQRALEEGSAVREFMPGDGEWYDLTVSIVDESELPEPQYTDTDAENRIGAQTPIAETPRQKQLRAIAAKQKRYFENLTGTTRKKASVVARVTRPLIIFPPEDKPNE